MNTYRFSTEYNTWWSSFPNDDEAFQYASDATDDVSANIEKWIETLTGGRFFDWDIEKQEWV